MGASVQTRRLIAWLVTLCAWPLALGAQPAGEEVVPEIIPPELLQSVAPVYPEAALAADVEADVVLQIDISEEGDVTLIEPMGLVYYTYADDGSAIEDPRDLLADEYGFIPPAIEAVEAYLFSAAQSVDPVTSEATAIPVRVTWRVGFVVEYEEVLVDAPVGEEPVVSEESQVTERIDPDGPVTLEGRLLIRGTRAPLVGRYIVVTSEEDESASVEVVSGNDGRFEVAGLAPGPWRIAVDEVGFYPVEVTEVVRSGEVTGVTFYVEENNFGEYTSETVAEAPRREVTRRVLQVAEIQRIPGNNNDAIRVVQNLPGVARPQFGGGDVIVRGSAPEDTGFFLDGIRIPLIYHFGGLRAVIPTEFIEEINFYPGGFAVDYGRATGGIIDIETRDDLAERWGGHIDVNLYDAGAFVRGPIGDNVMLEAGIRRSYIDAVLGAAADVIPLNFTTAPRYYDYQLRLSARLSETNTARIMFLGSDDQLDFVLEDEEDLEPQERGGIFAQTSFHGGIISLETELSDTLTHVMRLGIQYQVAAFEFGEDIRFDLRNGQGQFRDELRWQPSDRFALRTGLDVEYYPGRIELNLPLPPKEGEEPLDFEEAELIEAREEFNPVWPGAFIAAEFEPVDGLQLLPGVRGEYYSVPDRWAFDARLGARYQVSDLLLLKASVSNHHQAPTADETSDSFGNPDLRLENAIHYVTGAEFMLAEHITLGTDLFWKDMNSLVTSSGDVVVRNGETLPEIYDNDAVGRVYGAEFLLRHNLHNRFFGWIAYTVSRSERLEPDLDEYRLFDFDQTHILTVLGSYNLPKNWSIGARFRLTSGNPTTPIIGSTYSSTNDTYVRVAGEPNSDRLQAFHQLDVRIDKRWVRDRWRANLYLDLQNAYNQSNAEGINYSYDYSESGIISGLPLIPALGFRAEF